MSLTDAQISFFLQPLLWLPLLLLLFDSVFLTPSLLLLLFSVCRFLFVVFCLCFFFGPGQRLLAEACAHPSVVEPWPRLTRGFLDDAS